MAIKQEGPVRALEALVREPAGAPRAACEAPPTNLRVGVEAERALCEAEVPGEAEHGGGAGRAVTPRAGTARAGLPTGLAGARGRVLKGAVWAARETGASLGLEEEPLRAGAAGGRGGQAGLAGVGAGLTGLVEG